MNTPTVSLLIAAYKQSRELTRVLPRLVAQDYPAAIEFVICDDGSRSGTLACIRKWQREANIRYIWQPDLGFRLARSRNNGLRCATGELIICLDADAVVGRDFIARHAAAHSGSSSLVCGGRKRLFARELGNTAVDTELTTLLTCPERLQRLRSDDLFQLKYARSANPWVACVGANFSFTRRSHDLFFDEKFVGWGCEDQEFACRLWKRHGYRITVETTVTAVQIEWGSPRRFTNMRPRTQTEILQYLGNLLHFVDLYPDVDTSPLWNGLAFYVYDKSRDRWTVAAEPRFERAHIEGAICAAREWVSRRQAQAGGS